MRLASWARYFLSTKSAASSPLARQFDLPSYSLVIRLGFNAHLSSILAFIILPQVVACVMMMTWDDLDRFYTTRQPWASLATPSLASESIMLNYSACPGWRLLQGARNKHYWIFLLSLGSMLSPILPVLSANVFQLNTEIVRCCTVRGIQEYKWIGQERNWE
jgi:hypothetical protein